MPAYSIGRAIRGKSATTTPMTTPGPGSYVDRSAGRMIIPKWSMGTGQRDKLYDTGSTPGPGSYSQGSKFTGPKYHFGGRHGQSMTSFSPGPGQYVPNVDSQKKNTTFMYSMPGKGTDRGIRNGPPGPGSYNFSDPKQYSGGKFGRDPRASPILPSGVAVPGPGAYDSSKNASSKNSQMPKFSYLPLLLTQLDLD